MPFLGPLDFIFFHKIYTLGILIFYIKLLENSKLIHFGPIGRHPNLYKMARIVGPPFNLDFVQEIIEKKLIGPIGRLPELSKTAGILGFQIHELAFVGIT